MDAVVRERVRLDRLWRLGRRDIVDGREDRS